MLKVHYLVKRLTVRLIKAYKNYYNVIYFIYVILSNKLLIQKFSKVLMDLDCLSQNLSISCLHHYQKSANICVFCKFYYFSFHKHCPTSGGCSNVKLIHQKFWEFLIKSLFENIVQTRFEHIIIPTNVSKCAVNKAV